ncbi:MAG: F0F1 ATP synthase subunit B [Lysobacterales bacterium]|jgi:F-type H+-transporting ATPase subunit b
MNINATLILQSIAMLIFVWFCMQVVWPPILRALDERREKIADGLAASDRAEKALEEAQKEAETAIGEARDKAGTIVDQANQRHTQILDQAKEDALGERQRQVAAAEADIALATNQAREELRAAVASLSVLGASKILEREIDADAHRELIDKLIAEI